MPRSRTFLWGLVLAVLVGGIVGVGVAALVGAAQAGDWLPSQGTAIGASVAASVGFLVAWLMVGRRRPDPEPSAAPSQPGTTAVPQAEDEPVTRPAPLATTSPVASGPLTRAAVVLQGRATTRAEAIDEAGALLVESGAVDPGYVAAMHTRENGTSTHMGNALAVPRGSQGARQFVRRSALALVRYPATLDWHGNRVRFVVALAGVDDADQVRLVSRVAEVFLDDAAVARLESTDDPADVVEAFAAAGH